MNPLMALSQEEGNIGNSEEQLKDINSGFPCIDSSPECVQQLTEAAVSNSPQLKLLGEKIMIVEQQLELLGKRIEYSRKRSWTSYITIDPVKLLQNIFGGGDVQRDKLAIADLQVKTAQLESALAEMERQKDREVIMSELNILLPCLPSSWGNTPSPKLSGVLWWLCLKLKFPSIPIRPTSKVIVAQWNKYLGMRQWNFVSVSLA
jgi:hypothetical protein